MKDSLFKPASVISGFPCYHVKSTSSTNDLARILINEGVKRGVIVADEQTEGRGRRKRRWHSPAGGLWFSFFSPWETEDPVSPVFISFGIILAVLHTMESRFKKIPFRVKWPNDLYAAGKKFAGVLVETIEGKSGRMVIAGAGVNTWNRPFSQGTSLLDLGVTGPENHELLVKIMDRFVKGLGSNCSLNDLLKIWCSKDLLRGKLITIKNSKEEYTGSLAGYSESGAIQIKCEDGRVEEFASGEVSFAG